jgi:chemotaxis protein CheX
MNENEIKHFIQTTISFFKEVSGYEAKCGIPSVKTSDPLVLEYTGIIGISGKRKGSVYFTSNKGLLSDLAKIMLETDSVNNEDIRDLVGEVTNTITGNLRKIFGTEFLISVPAIVEGKARDIKLPDNIGTYVIPILWQDHKAFLVICLE